MPVFHNNVIAGAAGQSSASGTDYKISRSLRFNDGDTPNLTRTPSSDGNRKKWTWSGWVKRGVIGSSYALFGAYKNGTERDVLRFSSDKLELQIGTTGGFVSETTTTYFRDSSAWYHFVVVYDSTQTTAANRVKFYANGVEQPKSGPNVSENNESTINAAQLQLVGARSSSGSAELPFDGYIAEVYFLDGQALEPTAFGELNASTGLWNPIEFSGSYTTTPTTTSLSQTGWQTSQEGNIWDGDTSTVAHGYANNMVGTVTFDPPLTNVTKVEVYQQNYVHYLNGSSVTTSETDTEWHVLYNNSSSPITLTSLGNSYTNNTQTVDIFAIRINDSVVDAQTWTPPNSSGIVVQGGGENSYYLDFADNNSNAALGTDSSSNNTILPGVSFDGSGDSLYVGNSADYNFTGDFTAEAWVYVNSFNDDYAGIFGFSHDSDQHGWNVLLRSSGKPHINVDMNYTDVTGTLPLKKWTHIALVRSGSGSGNVKFYINGVADSTTLTETDETGTISSSQCMIGTYPGFTTRDFDGIISNVRLVKGTALYTSSFTPPTAPLANVTNTVLLCCQSSSSATSAAVAPGTLTANGNASATSKGDTDWAANNLLAKVTTPPYSWDGGTLNLSATGGSGNAGGYKNAYFQLPASGTASWDLHLETDGNCGFWFSDSTSASNTHPDEQSGNFVGLRNDGGGSAETGGSGFGSGTVSMPSDSMDGDPRWYFTVDRTNGSGTVKVGASGSASSFTVPTSGDVYFHVNAHGTYAFDLSEGDTNDIDSVLDTPTNYAADSGHNGGNYATFNYLQKNGGITLSNGNLQLQGSGSSWKSTQTTFAMKSGKWYCEFGPNLWKDNNNHCQPGIAGMGFGNSNEMGGTDFAAFYHYTGTKFFNGQGGAGTTFGDAWNNNTTNVIGIAFDADTRKVWFSLNGTWQDSGDPANGTGEAGVINEYEDGYSFTLGIHGTTDNPIPANFGATGSFKYTPPSGFQACCTQNLETPVIAESSDYFDVKTYTGAAAPAAAQPSTTLDSSTAYRHHRILCEGDNNGGSISEVQFFDASGLIDASDTNNSGGSISSNNNQVGSSDGLAAWTAFNGTLGGAGYANGVRKDPSSGFYIAKDWGSGVTKTVTGVKIWGVNGYAIAGNASSTYIKLQGSNDGSSWTDLQTFDDSRTGSWTSSSSTEVAHSSDIPTQVTGFGFSPDLVLIKKTSASADYALFDTFRGANKRLVANDTDGETTTTNTLTSFDSAGFSLGNANDVNQNSQSFVAWAWDIASSNTSISAGGLNSSAYHTSQTWSDNITTTGNSGTWHSSYPATQAFNGNDSNYAHANGNGSTAAVVTLTLDPAITATSSVSFRGGVTSSGAGTIAINGGTATSLVTTGTNPAATDITTVSFSGSITTITISKTATGAEGLLVYGFEIDGKRLIDSGTSVTNVPTIATTTRANATAGISIATWTGTGNAGSIAHSLGKKPDLVIAKVYGDSSYTDHWPTYHSGYGAGTYTYFNDNRAAPSSYTGFWNNVEPTSLVFNVGDDNSDNTKSLIAYCFTAVDGFSAFGTFSSGSDPFVPTDFSPKFVMIKRTDTASNWYLYDSERGYGRTESWLESNNDGQEQTHANGAFQFLSNGFQPLGGDIDPSSGTWIYAAFALSPFRTARAR